MPRLTDYITLHAQINPDQVALHEYHAEENNICPSITYRELDLQTDRIARQLISLGFQKGDIILVSHMMTIQFNQLCIAALKIGLIVATLDLRAKGKELVHLSRLIHPKAYFFVTTSAGKNIAEVIEGVKEDLGQMIPFTNWYQSGEILMDGIQLFPSFFGIDAPVLITENELQKSKKKVNRNDPAFIIFTIGSTGIIKPALLTNDNILVQTMNVANWNRKEPIFNRETIMMVNLPTSHVGGITEQLWTTLFVGGTAVLLPIFDPRQTIEALQEYKINTIGQIPAQYKLEFMLPEFDTYDLSSLKYLLYGGAMVNEIFLEKLKKIAPNIGTGMGLTETAGLTTFTDMDVDIKEYATFIGRSPQNYPFTIRFPMNSDGKAGKEKPIGEIGEICYRGRQTFLGFYNMPEETRKVLSKDGWFYSGDIGYQTPDGRLALQGRSKMMIRTKGYNVFPAEVEQTLKANPAIKDAIVIGRPHRIFDEAIIALVQPKAPLKPNDLTQEIFDKAVEDLAGYKKPLLFIPVQSLPPNRVTRADFESVIVKADEVIENLRSQGKYDVG